MKTVFINPPPTDRKCMRCGVHTDELKEFGGAGDPLVGDFKGKKLVKTFRSMIDNIAPIHQEILDKMECNDEKGSTNIDELENEYGGELVNKAMFADQLYNTIGASWECRDCIIENT